MKETLSLKRPLSNEDGFAIIIMIAVVMVVIGSYTLYAANYFQILTVEVKRFKRQINGIAIMQQVGQKVADARARHEATWTGLAFNCATAAPFTSEHKQLCLKPIVGGDKSTQICIKNPFGSPAAGTDIICLNAGAGAGAGDLRTIEVSLTDEQLKGAPKIPEGWWHQLNMFVGESAVALIHSAASQAQAYDDRDRPALAGQPTLTRPVVACANGDIAPTSACMQCKKAFAVPPAGGRFPVCYRVRICIRQGGCNAANPEQWFWQIIAVTSPGYGA